MTKKKRILREIAEWIFLIIAAFLITSVIQSELFALTEVNMESMVETLEPGDKLIMSKLAYTFSEPERGDIIIFLRNEPVGGIIGRASIFINDISLKMRKQFRRNRLIKRVIGIPGDTIEIRDNILYVNGEPQNEPYARIDPMENKVLNGELEKTVVYPGELFVMGDNRGQSLDSRNFGKIDMSWVEGKAIFRVMPFSKFGSIYR
ncbi:MAG TPA: signal peptidase I [Clostridiaceae bacterium]|nr:signal peptidase I [Clostridiaceae bacterium]